MNWEALGAIGEIVGAVAVVLTLGYLAVQIRQNTRAVRAASFQTIDQSRSDFLSTILDPEVLDVYLRGMRDRSTLPEIERAKFDILMNKLFTGLENQLYQYEHGNSEEEVLECLRGVTRWYFRHPGVKQWWEVKVAPYTETFTRFVENEAASIEASRPPS